VASQAQTAPLVGSGHEAEEQLAACGVERREAELVEQDQISAQQPVDEAADGVVGLPASSNSRRGCGLSVATTAHFHMATRKVGRRHPPAVGAQPIRAAEIELTGAL